MSKKQTDRHLDVPGEANRDKHINFVAAERKEIDPAEEPSKGASGKESNYRQNKAKRNKKAKNKPQ